jgi:prepilin-type N-terminal cleavage/methylation domain-containing protein
MRRDMRRRVSPGFTLLEVLLATAIMAVGTTSVLVVIATAAGMASQRQVGVRREQVVDEARHDAQAMVDAFDPGVPDTAVQVIATKKGAAKPVTATKQAPDKVIGKKSARYDGFTYDLAFDAKDPTVPEMGFDVWITLHYGGGELSYAAPMASMIGKTISDDEFKRSSTYLEEQKAPSSPGKAKEMNK